MKDIIFIPTYNEQNNIRVLIPEIFNIFPEIHILVIDDASPDGTGEEVEALMRRYQNLNLLKRQQKNGLGEAYKDAMKRTVSDTDIRFIISMDADGSHSPAELPHFLKKLQQYDMVIGSRYVKGGGVANWEPWRKFLSKYGNLYSVFFTQIGVRDLTAGFIGAKRELLEKVDFDSISSQGYAYLIELKFECIYFLGATHIEHPILFGSRREGESKISNHIIEEGLKTPVKLFFKKLRVGKDRKKRWKT